MNFVQRKSKSGDKIYFYYDFGRKQGQRQEIHQRFCLFEDASLITIDEDYRFLCHGEGKRR
jgi:hypothetical protein